MNVGAPIVRKLLYSSFLFLFAIVACYSLYLSFFYIHGYMKFISEDGFIEYGSSISWLVSALVLSVFYFKKYGFHFDSRGFYYLLMIFLFILFCGEEISWGQRIFDLKTPEYLSKINVQNEITIHNIGHISIFSNLFFVGNIVFFFYFGKALSRIKFFNRYLDIATPSKKTIFVFSASLVIWIIIGVRFGTLGFHPYSIYAENYYTQMDDEIFEFFAAVSFFCYAFFDVLLPDS